MMHPTIRSRFYIHAAVFVVALNVVGFLPSIIDPSRRSGPPTVLVRAHGALAAAWLLLFLVQSVLAFKGRLTLHRRIGRVAPFLAAAMIAAGAMTVVVMTRRGYDLSGDISRAAIAPGAPRPSREELAIAMFAPLQAFAHFGLLTALGLWFRHRPELHRRLMLLGLAQLVLTPLIHVSGRLAGTWPAVQGVSSVAIPLIAGALLFAGAVHDKRTQGRIHPINLWVPIALIVETVLTAAWVVPTAAWRRIALLLVNF